MVKILCAYIRMLSAQIGKLPVSVGNGSGRIETSTTLSLYNHFKLHLNFLLSSFMSIHLLV